ncbi:MAG: hypothetical protein JSW67_08870 [Candidatus Latescibacterota bacterium]|nr:MAG: hypothetical protein JSW67_08870 [Candidatus Latescibacterota bacterium]
MLDFLDLLLDWKRLVALGTDVTIYFMMGLLATLLFMIRLAISLFAGTDADFDVDADIGDAGSGFTFFSTLSILAFFMGAGWMGVACRVDWQLSGLPSAAIASGFGFGMMLLASGLMYLTRRLNRTVRYDPSTAVGRTGRVYMAIPEKGMGRGQVEVSVSGRRKIMAAVSNGASIDAFTDVMVIDAQDDETLVVEPKS